MLLAASPAAKAEIDCSTSRGEFRVLTSDGWFGIDKAEHFGASLPFGALGGYLTRDRDPPLVYGALIGSIPGLLKERFDDTCLSDCFSYKGLTADAVERSQAAHVQASQLRIRETLTPVRLLSPILCSSKFKWSGIGQRQLRVNLIPQTRSPA